MFSLDPSNQTPSHPRNMSPMQRNQSPHRFDFSEMQNRQDLRAPRSRSNRRFKRPDSLSGGKSGNNRSKSGPLDSASSAQENFVDCINCEFGVQTPVNQLNFGTSPCTNPLIKTNLQDLTQHPSYSNIMLKNQKAEYLPHRVSTEITKKLTRIQKRRKRNTKI